MSCMCSRFGRNVRIQCFHIVNLIVLQATATTVVVAAEAAAVETMVDRMVDKIIPADQTGGLIIKKHNAFEFLNNNSLIEKFSQKQKLNCQI